MSNIEARNIRNGLIFISPFIIGFLCFILYPTFASFYYSFNDYPIFKPPKWVGIEQYKTLLSKDPLFWRSLYNTFYFTIFSVPLGAIVALSLAFLLNAKVKGLALFRTIFFLPAIVPTVAASILWIWVLNPQWGVLNYFLGLFKIPGPGWLADPVWSKPALILMSTWTVGYDVVLYLAGLQDVPQELYEAAELDGASAWQKTIHIALPMISPVILFTVTMGLIGSFQYFTQAYVMTRGGPADSTLFYSLYLFRNAFVFFKMGYASAMAWILFVIILLGTLIVFRSSARLVYYRGKA